MQHLQKHLFKTKIGAATVRFTKYMINKCFWKSNYCNKSDKNNYLQVGISDKNKYLQVGIV